MHYGQRHRFRIRQWDVGAKAKVDEGELAVWCDEEVSRMGISVEETGFKQLNEKAFEADRD